jgi:jumonji domain-containing protein 2
MFSWHTEDLDLYSINYLHTGKSKFWYCIARDEGWKLEHLVKSHFADNFTKCSEFLRHKTIVVSPYHLLNHYKDIKISKTVHNPGEFIITFGKTYHSGFNWGFNIAEAVNYATPKWLKLFIEAKPCKCITDSVKIDKEEF